MRAIDWHLPFMLMCEASDLALGAVLGQRVEGKLYVVSYARKTFNAEQRNYTTTEKELLAVVYALDEFRSYHIIQHSNIYSQNRIPRLGLLDGFHCYKSSTSRLEIRRAWRTLLSIISPD